MLRYFVNKNKKRFNFGISGFHFQIKNNQLGLPKFAWLIDIYSIFLDISQNQYTENDCKKFVIT